MSEFLSVLGAPGFPLCQDTSSLMVTALLQTKLFKVDGLHTNTAIIIFCLYYLQTYAREISHFKGSKILSIRVLFFAVIKYGKVA